MFDTSAVKNLVEANLYKPNAIEPTPPQFKYGLKHVFPQVQCSPDP